MTAWVRAHSTYPEGDAIWAGTILFAADTLTLDDAVWTLPDGFGRWDLNMHSVVDVCRFEVTGGPFGQRRVELYGDMEESLEEASMGRPLPFEEPFLRGEHPISTTTRCRSTPSSSATRPRRGMFGIEGETPPDDAVIAPVIAQIRGHDDVMVHRFVPAAAQPEPKKGLFGKLFGR